VDISLAQDIEARYIEPTSHFHWPYGYDGCGEGNALAGKSGFTAHDSGWSIRRGCPRRCDVWIADARYGMFKIKGTQEVHTESTDTDIHVFY
jgi:hypothetical protein